jgi:hypothetical protein
VTPGNLELVDVVVSMNVWTAGVAFILLVDERLVTPSRLERGWLVATRDAAILGGFLFGLLYAVPALLVHFIKTRRSFAGFLIGLACGIVLFGLDVYQEIGAESAIDWLGL